LSGGSSAKEAEEQVRVRVEREKKIRGRVGRGRAEKLSRKYNQQACYFIQYYDPDLRAPVGVIPVRTQPTLESVLRDLEKLGLYPLILPQPVYVPQSFWEEYRHSKNQVAIVKEYGLLTDASIYRFETVVIDIDSSFENVYPVWNELKERIGLRSGYQVYKTKSGRFRAYIYLLDGTKDLKRARELVAIIYAFFEKKELNPDETFVYRLNHPVFYEEFSLYSYELIEEVEGGNVFFRLYRKVKKLQKELNLYTFKGKNLTEDIWGKKAPTKKKDFRKGCRIIKAPAFVRRLQENTLDNLELWKRAVISLSGKHNSYRYIHVIQPAVGWAKYLELPENEVTEFLIGLLGENKRKDIEKGWKYARELEFTVSDSVKWVGKTREEWEGEVMLYLQFKKEVSRQELLKEVFGNKKWLCDIIMDGLVEKGIVAASFVIHGRGRPRKIYKLVEEMRLPLRKAVGWEGELFTILNSKGQVNQELSFVRGKEEDFSHNNNSPFGRAMGGGWEEGQGERIEGVVIGVGMGERDGGGRRKWEDGGGEIGLISTRWRADFEFWDVSSGGKGGGSSGRFGEGQRDDVDIVELWEEGLFEF